MHHSILDELCTDHYEVRWMCGTDNTSAFHDSLKKDGLVLLLSAMYDCGEVEDGEIQEFVDRLLSAHYEKGVFFPFDTALSAICVAMEDKRTPFANQFLKSLLSVFGGTCVEFLKTSRMSKMCFEINEKS